MPCGDGAGLVEYHHIHGGGAFQRLGVAVQHAVLRALAGGDCDRQRRGQTQRAWACDHQHADRTDDAVGVLPHWAPQPPCHKGPQCDQHHGWHEHGGHTVRDALDRRLRRLRRLDERDDLRERRVGAHTCSTVADRTGRVDGRANDLAPRTLGDRHRLARDHRFIHGGRAIGHHAIHGYALPRPDLHNVTNVHVVGRDIDHCTAAHHMRRVGAQPDERADRRACAGTRARLQQLPQNHQRDDHADGLVVWLARAPRQQARPERDDE